MSGGSVLEQLGRRQLTKVAKKKEFRSEKRLETKRRH